MAAYYNEFDTHAAAWIRELIKQKLIAGGEVDERSITEVSQDDLRGFSQCHFFAGIGGWSLALRLAGIPDDYPVWTASLPCQPFSAAGKQLGKADERHLLPHFLELVRQCQPYRIFGEQVEAAIRHRWLDDLRTAMEAEGYAVGSTVLGAHSVGAPHIRQRLYWVADGYRLRPSTRGEGRQADGYGQAAESDCGAGVVGVVGDSESDDQYGNRKSRSRDGQKMQIGGSGSFSVMGNTGSARFQTRQRETVSTSRRREEGRAAMQPGSSFYAHHADALHIDWRTADWIACRDEKWRPVEPGTFPLVDGLPKCLVRSGDQSAPLDAQATAEARVMRLKGYGNAIVPQVAAEFIGAFMDVI
jgi:DNA (cytosine-5)-methyltransferase 1